MDKKQRTSDKNGLSGIDGEIGTNLLVRIGQLETHLEYIAKREDISEVKTEIEKVRGEIPNLKVWVLLGALFAITVLANIITIFLSKLITST